ncbi:hypothetical protein KCU83_g114, partial [Aureobasidium melanogenum]
MCWGWLYGNVSDAMLYSTTFSLHPPNVEVRTGKERKPADLGVATDNLISLCGASHHCHLPCSEPIEPDDNFSPLWAEIQFAMEPL